jgi:hypothetical protein
MGLIGNVIGGISSDVGNSISNVAKGVGGALSGGADIAKGALTLNPKEMTSGASKAVGSTLEAATSASALTPEGLEASAANNLLDGAVSSLGSGTASS